MNVPSNYFDSFMEGPISGSQRGSYGRRNVGLQVTHKRAERLAAA